MNARKRFPDAYRAGLLQAQLESAGASPYTDTDDEIADLAIKAEQHGEHDAAARLTGAMGTPQPPAGLDPEDQADWWLAFYAGRQDGRQ